MLTPESFGLIALVVLGVISTGVELKEANDFITNGGLVSSKSR
jgi:hypothetical protein